MLAYRPLTASASRQDGKDRQIAVIRLTREGDKWEIVAETRGYGVYLDNFAIIDFAKGCPSQRRRFVSALRDRGTLLFSWANAVEIAGPQGGSADAARAFLNSIGPHWIPLESNAWEVARKENAGRATDSAVSEHFMRTFFQERVAELLSEGGPGPDLPSESFFELGTVLDWVQADRDKVRTYREQLDDALRGRLDWLRAEYDRDMASLDRLLPPCEFDPNRLGNFVLVHLQRMLVQEAKSYSFAPHDGLDFCHAIMAAAYGSVIALDKAWKRRVEALPHADQLARTYYRPELDQLVGLLESRSLS